jgi:signal transduction histidine kinase
MLINKVLASFTFRFMSTYVASLSVAGLVVLTLIYTMYSYDYFKELGDSIDHELLNLEKIFSQGAIPAVNRFVKTKNRLNEQNRFFYLVVDNNYNRLAGNLDAWPEYKQYRNGWLGFQLDIFQWDGRELDTGFIARTKQLDNGYRLLVARHYNDVLTSANLVAGVLIRSMIVMTVLGTIGGAIVAGISVKQVDVINRSLQRIMTGDLSERIIIDNQRGELRELTLNLNRMLDRIQTLMTGVRQVTDNIAHDLRTPLTRMRNHLAQLQDHGEENSQETVQQLIEEADGLLSTFNALLRIAHIESGSRRSGFQRVDLKVILLDVIELYEPLAMDKSIALDVSLASGVQLDGDRDLLFQAFANLIDNAIKYTPQDGKISVRLTLLPEAMPVAEITIADSGLGIPNQDKDKVFRRFFRVEASRGEQPGNGLGLSLVLAVIKLHDGNIALSDNNPGLAVDVILPLEKSAAINY